MIFLATILGKFHASNQASNLRDFLIFKVYIISDTFYEPFQILSDSPSLVSAATAFRLQPPLLLGSSRLYVGAEHPIFVPMPLPLPFQNTHNPAGEPLTSGRQELVNKFSPLSIVPINHGPSRDSPYIASGMITVTLTISHTQQWPAQKHLTLPLS